MVDGSVNPVEIVMAKVSGGRAVMVTAARVVVVVVK